MALARQAAQLQRLGADRLCLVNDDLEAALLSKDYFATWEKRGDAGAGVMNAGAMGRAMGMNFYSSLNFPIDTHAAAGAGAGTTNNTTNNNIGDTALYFDSSTGAYNAGDRIKVAGVNRPLIVQSTTSGASGNIPLVDPITEVIPDNAAITVVGSGQSNLAAKGVIMDKACIGFAMPLLDAPSDKPSSIQSRNGYSLRVVTGYNQSTKTETLSIDCLVGAEAYDPRRMTLLREY